MSRKLGLLIILVIALVLGTALHLHEVSGFDPVQSPLAIAGKTVGLFIFPGLLPLIVWACMKFRAVRLKPVMFGWILLQLIFAGLIYAGIGQQAVTGG